MKICVVGAGAIGGFLGVRLHNRGHDVTLVARGPHLAAIKRNGLTLRLNDGSEERAVGIRASDDMRGLGAQDLVVLALKSHQIAPVVEDIRSLFGPETIVLTTQNGIPWWYFHKQGGEFEGRSLHSVDPDGVIAAHVEPERVIGCIAYPAAEIAEPGVVRHVEGDRFPIGEPDGSESERAKMISAMLIDAGFKAPILSDFRSELWLKLWGNLSFNPISALTHATLVDICRFPETRRLAESMMTEAQAVAERLGASFRVSLHRRIAGAEKVGAHKTSMLQDVEQGKTTELDALLGAVVELGRLARVPTPHLEAVYALAKLLDDTIDRKGVTVRARPHAGRAPRDRDAAPRGAVAAA